MPKSKKSRTYVTSPARPVISAKINIPETPHTPITEQRIVFSLECCNGACCFKKVKDNVGKIGFASQLHTLSQLTWGEAIQSHKRGLGYEALDHVQLPHKVELPKGARTIAFVFHRPRRMIGYRDQQGVFHIRWFDYDGKRYKHSK